MQPKKHWNTPLVVHMTRQSRQAEQVRFLILKVWSWRASVAYTPLFFDKFFDKLFDNFFTSTW